MRTPVRRREDPSCLTLSRHRAETRSLTRTIPLKERAKKIRQYLISVLKSTRTANVEIMQLQRILLRVRQSRYFVVTSDRVSRYKIVTGAEHTPRPSIVTTCRYYLPVSRTRYYLRYKVESTVDAGQKYRDLRDRKNRGELKHILWMSSY